MATKVTRKTPVNTNIFTSESRPGMTFDYNIVEAPKHTRETKAEPNPHDGGVAKAVELMSDPTKALSFYVSTDEAKKNVTWLRKAGASRGVTIVIVLSEPTTDGRVLLSFRATAKVSRKRKNGTTETPASA